MTEPAKQRTSLLEYMGALVAFNVMTVYAFTVVAPYVTRLSTNPVMLEIIKSNKSTVDLITTAVVMFYFGASARGRKDQETLATAVNTNAAAQAALAPVIGADTLNPDKETITVAPGEEKTVLGVDDK